MKQNIKRTLQAYPSALPFIKYFERSWPYNSNLHPHHLWNYYNAVLRDQPRTNNNHSKGSNNALNNAAACLTPSAVRLMDIIKKFNTDAELAVLHSITGKPPTPKQVIRSVLLSCYGFMGIRTLERSDSRALIT